jgi:hypothetical protein
MIKYCLVGDIKALYKVLTVSSFSRESQNFIYYIKNFMRRETYEYDSKQSK